ncbi:MAG: hypothetical protein E6G17_01365 [Actinobacteria bacterium]|nr:MAG: hypothetical protein E6G17_01365 [Actinomycetota bacterium]
MTPEATEATRPLCLMVSGHGWTDDEVVAAFVRWCHATDRRLEMVHQGEVERAWRAVLSAIEVLGEDEDEALCCVGASFLEDLVQDHHHELWPRIKAAAEGSRRFRLALECVHLPRALGGRVKELLARFD